ncbi:hypothetical protein AB0F72_27800 [Actinoplanes sp. NPDC023936]|uniref:hypothetical protein n=1 Tax=Actinoplanes sp. NPDC023936 TaxID=3154910 RepID=UPI0033E7E235
MTHGHRMLITAVPMLILAAALSGCGDSPAEPQVASAGGAVAPSSDAGTAADGGELGRKFAQCMRAEGVDMPDPGADGMVAMPGIKAGDEAAMNKTDAALQKCREFMPDGGEPTTISAEDLSRMREYAKCARENGVPDFPDPDPDTGRFAITPDKADEIRDLSKVTDKCQQLGAGVAVNVEVTG